MDVAVELVIWPVQRVIIYSFDPFNKHKIIERDKWVQKHHRLSFFIAFLYLLARWLVISTLFDHRWKHKNIFAPHTLPTTEVAWGV